MKNVIEYKAGDKVPWQFCHLLERKTDRQWTLEMPASELLDVEKIGKRMLRSIFKSDCYRLKILGEQGAIEPDYEASIYTEGYKVDENCWSSWGFWIEQREI